LLRQALHEDPTNSLLYYFLGEALEKTRQDAEALKLYETAIAKNVANANRIYVRMALIYGRTGRVEDGISAFEKAVDSDPTDVETLNRLAVAYLMKGRQSEAERVLKAILVLNPESAQALNSLGWIALGAKETDKARTRFEQALKADPEFLEPHINLARLCRDVGDYNCAREHFEAFLSKAPVRRYRDSVPRIKGELTALQQRRHNGSR
jgi:protein O-GlcNAc transferase